MIKNIDILMVISHPDDDAVFAGELQKRWNFLNWYVVCVTWNKDSERGKELISWQTSMSTYPENIYFLDFEDDPNDVRQGISSIDISEIEMRLKKLLLEPKLVVTHNDKGEYGHPHHITTHKAVLNVYKDKRKLFFGYGRDFYDILLHRFDKSEAIRRIYGSQAWVVDMFNPTAETFIWE